MKQFFLTLLAVLIGGFLALLGYDHFIVKPREAKAASATAAAIASTISSADPPKAEPAQPNLSKTREDARQVADEVEASVQRSVDKAREAMDAQANDMDRRASVASAVSRATMFRAAISEFYQSNGRWPRSSDDAGLPSSEEMRGGGVEGIDLGERGAVIVRLEKSLSPNGRIVLRPKASDGAGIVDWRCELEGDASLKPLLPRCELVR